MKRTTNSFLIETIKDRAWAANARGDQVTVNECIDALDACWQDHRAAFLFYKALEQTAKRMEPSNEKLAKAANDSGAFLPFVCIAG